MAKSSGKVGKSTAKAKPKEDGADFHRKQAQMHSAKARLHGAKAELIDAQNPKKKPSYPY